jgi:ribosomal-protein-alanine N-acetyltransferase
MAEPCLRTPRLLLRPFRDEDCAPFAALNADPLVMEHFPARLSREESDAVVSRIGAHFHEHGYGMWAAEVPGVAPFIGFIGLSRLSWQAHFTPCVEVGWRLSREHWGAGYASEGARAALAYAFSTLGLDEVVAMTIPANQRSRRVMEKLNMLHDPGDDFDHPRIAAGHPMQRHVLYRLARVRWAP